MEATQSYPNLLSEKQAAKRLGVARITLLRAREAGRIRFFRIGTRVLYCAEQLKEFLETCERNRHRERVRGPERHIAKRKDNHVSQSGRTVFEPNTRNRGSATESAEARQASLPFSEGPRVS
jgi:excisionase family DNA binding protein